MAIQIKDVAIELYSDLSDPADTSVGAITFWLLNNVGQLNNLLKQSYSVNDDGLDITPSIGENEKSVYKKIYLIHYYDKQIRDNLGASAFSSVLEIDEGGARVRLINKNEVAKTYVQLRKEVMAELKEQVVAYGTNDITPLSVDGADYIAPDETSTTDYSRVRSLL